MFDFDFSAGLSYLQLHLTNPGVITGFVLFFYGVLRNFINFLTCPEIYGRHGFKKGSYPQDSFARKQLDSIRSRCGEFPKPFPNGWYKICESEELKVGQVLTLTALGREFVAFRGEDGVAGVIDAFCPHLGTHLGHGGVVKGKNLVCPYHLWEFDCNGKNQNIPYCKKDMSNSSRVNVKNYVTREVKELGAVFFWYHIEKEFAKTPLWDLHSGLLDIAKEVKEGKMKSVWFNRWDDMLLHIFEPSQNSADDFHFATVHQYLPMPFNLKLLKVRHTIRTHYGQDEAKTPEAQQENQAKNKYNLKRVDMMIREQIDEIRFLDWFTVPYIQKFITTHVHMQGPNDILFMVDTPMGKFRSHFALIPIEPFRQKATMRMYCDKNIPWIVARVLMWWIRETADQDRQVWEHKVHISPRNLVLGDGPFVPYGKWLDYFYSENSIGWEMFSPGGKLSLDW